jgi:predicted NBD/HSP70 family sugar kinase
MSIRFGVDLGGTKIEVIALNDRGQPIKQKRVVTPQGDYQGTLRAIADLVLALEAELGLTPPVGIGLPGSVSPTTGLIRNANSTCLNGHPLKQDIEKLLARPVALSNDANCFALSEATDGAASGAESVFAVIIGTGTGAGFVVDGCVIHGANGIAGEWGHNPLPWPVGDELPGPECWCGLSGCIETWLSGPGLARDHLEHSGESASPESIVAASELGNKHAEASMQRYEHRLARALAHIINILDPEVIVLGGGMSNISRLYSNVSAIWGRYIFSDNVKTLLVPPMYGDSSGVRGAAWLAE